MKTYWEIPGPSKSPKQPCMAFMKYDGSNMRFEWSKKQGWHKFGTRHTMFGPGDQMWGKAIDIFNDCYAEDLIKVFKEDKKIRQAQSVLVFCEYFGPKSFAGLHDPDDDMELVLFDINIHKRGIMSPQDFVHKFGHLKIPEVVYEGNFNNQFVQDVKDGKYGAEEEGIVAKGVLPGKKAPHGLWMSKVKTKWWIDQLRIRCTSSDNFKKTLEDNEKEQNENI